MKRFNYILSVLSIMGLLLNLSCRREMSNEQPMEGGYVQIDPKWSDDVIRSKQLLYAFYDENGKFIRQVAKSNNERVMERFPAGNYRVIIYNTDGVKVDFRGMEDYATAEVFTSLALKSSTITVIPEPSRIFGIGHCNEYEQLPVRVNEVTTATASPVALTKHITLKFRVINVDDVSLISGKLDGVAEGIFLSTGKFNWSTSGGVPFTARADDATNKNFTATIEVFDVITSEKSEKNTNNVDVTIARPGGNNNLNIDITDVVKDILDNHGGSIPIDIPVEVEVELEMTPMGGVTVKILPWDESGTGGGGITE